MAKEAPPISEGCRAGAHELCGFPAFCLCACHAADLTEIEDIKGD